MREENHFENELDMKKTIPWWLVLIGLVVIILAPYFFTRPAFWAELNFTKTGEIGDTIGGLTAPFINGLAALLVYYTFRQQREANYQLRLQQQYDNIESHLTSINQYTLMVGTMVVPLDTITTKIKESEPKLARKETDQELIVLLDKVLLLMQDFQLVRKRLIKFKGTFEDRMYLQRKFIMLYTLKYGTAIQDLDRFFRKLDFVPISEYESYILEMDEINKDITGYLREIESAGIEVKPFSKRPAR